MYCFSLFFAKKEKHLLALHPYIGENESHSLFLCMRLAHREKYALTFKLCAFALCPGFHANGVREKRGVRGENEAFREKRSVKKRKVRKNKRSANASLRIFFGAGSRGRTDMVSLPPDFESGASANSTIPAENAAAFATTRHIIPHSCEKIKGFSKKSEKNPKWV